MAPSTTASKAKPTPASSQEKQKMLLASDAGHFSLLRALHLADCITLLNGFCGFMSIISSLRFVLLSATATAANAIVQSTVGHKKNAHIEPVALDYTHVYMALTFIPLGLFFDFLDGKVARWRHKSSLMGQELDSLADLVSFGVAPACAAWSLGLRTQLDTIGLAFFVLCGLLRLARFNVTVSVLPKDATGKSRYFEGFPIPSSLGLVLAMGVCVYAGAVEGASGVPGGVVDLVSLWPEWVQGWTSAEWTAVHPAVGVFVVWGCLMVSKTIHIPKP